MLHLVPNKTIVLLLYSHVPYHNDTIINRRRETSLEKYIRLTLFVRVQKGYSRFACERELETEQKLSYFDPIVMTVNVVSFLFFDAQPEAQGPLCCVIAFFIASYPHLLWTPTHQGLKAPSAWCGFSYHISSTSDSNATGNPTGFDFCLNWAI